jgi:hypothetical protein
MKTTFCAAWLILTATLSAAASPEHVYRGSIHTILVYGSELYEALNPQYQKQLYPRPVCMGPLDSPVINPVGSQTENVTLSQVFISVGFIDLLNHLAHAKAIDDVQPGFFRQYVLAMGNAADSKPQEIEEPGFWTEDVVNAQMGYFNQMIGSITAINLAHGYLGHLNKYAGEMSATKLTPINDLLTPAEWDASLKAGMRNAFDLALGTKGIKALFEAIDTMPKRPAWTAYIAPSHADLKKTNEELTALEDDYFHGRLKD